jgi:hypothetical protein
MLVLLNATYPPSSVKKAIEVFTSPELPKRPDYAKELVSFVYGDGESYHTLFVLDVEDSRLAEYLRMQADRGMYMQTRIPGFRLETRIGQPVMDAIATASRYLPK